MADSEKTQVRIYESHEMKEHISNEELPEKVRETLAAKEKKDGNGIFVITFLLFFAMAFLRNGSFISVAYLVLVILIHELGHFLGMKIFKYANPRIFFLPGLGAAAGADSRSEKHWHEIVVLLLGPLPGLFAGILLLVLSPMIHFPEKMALIDMLIFINAFNLLPFMPLDGGRVMNEALFQKNPALEVLFKVMGILALMAYAFISGSYIFGIFTVFMLFSVSESYRRSKAVKAVRDIVGSDSPEEEEHMIIARTAVEKVFKNHAGIPMYLERIAVVFQDSRIKLMGKVGSIITTISYVGIVVASIFGFFIGSVIMVHFDDDFEEYLESTNEELITEGLEQPQLLPILHESSDEE